MSFFNSPKTIIKQCENIDEKEHIKSFFNKYIKDAVLIWCFGLCILISSVVIEQNEKNMSQKRQEMKIYHIKNNEQQVSGTINSEELDASSLNAKYALLMDATNRRVLFEKEGYSKAPMASTTKIMTLIIALENGNVNDIVNVSDYAASMPDVQLNIKAGEQYLLLDLLYSLMLESHNDTAVAIAEHIGGTVEGFASMMNEKAKELGAYSTNFVTPNGLDAQNHYTTAYDLALIASYAIENQTFLDIIQTATHTFHEQTTGKTFTVNNKDAFLKMYEGAIGIKTGFTGDAGYCFVGAVKNEGKTFVSVVLACGWPPHKGYKWKDTKRIMEYGSKNYKMKEIVKAGTFFQEVPVFDSIEGGSIQPYVKDCVSLLIKDGEIIEYDVKLPKSLIAPIKKNQTVGKLIIYINDEKYKVLPLYSDEKKSKITYGYIFKRICLQYINLSEV